jgi:threonine/homoserine/homoserine lactone efflux protein
MPAGGHLVEFVLASVAIILAPGPSVMFVIARAIAWGRTTAVLTAVGNALGMVLLSVAVAVGLGPVLQRWPLVLAAVQLGGGLYLMYLGGQALQQRRAPATDAVAVTQARPNAVATVRQGFLVGVMNPKALVFFAAVFPQFVDPDAGSLTGQLLAFGLVFAGLACLLDGTWGLLVGGSRDWFARSHNRLVALRTVGGAVMVLLGATVVAPLAWGLLT